MKNFPNTHTQRMSGNKVQGKAKKDYVEKEGYFHKKLLTSIRIVMIASVLQIGLLGIVTWSVVDDFVLNTSQPIQTINGKIQNSGVSRGRSSFKSNGYIIYNSGAVIN